MHLVLLVLGILLAALGASMVAWGIPIHEFGLGNTLIVGGMTALVGGLLLVGLALAVRQLRRIAETLDLQPMAWNAGATEATVRRIPPVLSPVPDAEKTEEEREPEPAAPEPPARSAEPVAMPAPRRSLRDWIERGGPRTVPPEEIPQPAPVRPPEPARSRVDLSALARMPEEPIEAARPEPAPPKRSFLSRRTSRPTQAEPSSNEAEVRVYKSGVVDGMSYTLYTDGSIDAELPEGTVRFGSIDELRAHLTARR
jgi:hypothetical protein